MGVAFDPISGNIIIIPTTQTTNVLSIPPNGKLPVKNLYVDSETGKLDVQYEDSPQDTWEYVQSAPPTGKYKVNNLFVDPETGKLEVEYDTTPQE